jgi:hypothetical protein
MSIIYETNYFINFGMDVLYLFIYYYVASRINYLQCGVR